MDYINIEHFGESCDEPPGPLEEVASQLQYPLCSHELSLMENYDSQVDDNTWKDVRSHEDGMILQGSGDDSVPEETLGIRSDLDGNLFDVLLSYEPEPSTGISMPINPYGDNASGYDVPMTCSSSSMKFATPMDQSQLQAGSPCSAQSLLPARYYFQKPHASLPRKADFKIKINTNFTESLEHQRFSDTGGQAPLYATRSIQEHRRDSPDGQAITHHALEPVEIRPKRSNAAKGDRFPGLKTPNAAESKHTGIYSKTGFDSLGILSRVFTRPAPKINIGAVDLSCAFVLCDILGPDLPIVYISEAFERLTGYTKDEILGRNCRFLQDPEGKLDAGSKRSFVDGQTVYRLRSSIYGRTEIQASIINYRKGGQPFLNLITMIPIQWDTEQYRFYVGFQVDLIERLDATQRRMTGQTSGIDYRRDQLGQFLVPPPDLRGLRPDLGTHFGQDEVTAILDAVSATGSEVSQHTLDRILVENVDDFIHVLSFNGDYIFLSPSCKKILGYDPIELDGKALSTICHPDDIGLVLGELRASTSSAPVNVTYRIRQKFKGYIWFENHGAWHTDPVQGRQYIVMTGRPRPVYSFVQAALTGSWTTLANNDMWAKVTLSGIILFVTSRVKIFTGFDPDDLIGKDIHELMFALKPNAIAEALEAAAKGQRIEFGEKKCSNRINDRSSFRHRMCHKDGHNLSAHTTLYVGEINHSNRPSFLVAHTRFAESRLSLAAPIAAYKKQEIGCVPSISRMSNPNFQHLNSSAPVASLDQKASEISSAAGISDFSSRYRSSLSPEANANLFSEWNFAHGRSWQTELRDLKIQNNALSNELHCLLEQRKERKRKQTAISLEKLCAVCNTKSTPEWRRGPSGNRDLCNRCGLRWKKLVRNQAQAAACASAADKSDI